MIRLLSNPLSAALPAGWKKNAGLAPGSVFDSPPFAPWRLAGDSPGDGSALPPGAGSWFTPASPGFVDAGKVEVLAAQVAGIVNRRFKLEYELYSVVSGGHGKVAGGRCDPDAANRSEQPPHCCSRCPF